MAIIFTQSSFPSVDLPKIEFIAADKLIHFGVYGLLSILCYLSLIHQTKFKIFNDKTYFWTVLITSIYGMTDEFHQYFVPNRSCEFQDWLADSIGAIIGVLLVKYTLKKFFKIFVTA